MAEQTTNYSDGVPTQATGEEGIGEITSEEELLGYLTPEEASEIKPSEEKPSEERLPVVAAKEDEDDDIDLESGLPKSVLAAVNGHPEDTPEDKSTDKPKEQEFNNLVEFINDRYDLKLNIDTLPKDMSREEEANLVGELYDKVVDGANVKVNEFRDIQETLKDKEVANFIAAKRDGKTLKDFVTEYAESTMGKSDEEIVKDSLKSTAPNMSDEDINEVVQSLKEKGKLEIMATEARKKIVADEELVKADKEKSDIAQTEQDKKDMLVEVQNYTDYVGKIANINGVPLDSKMRSELIVAATQPDKDGMTYLERALQSDLGVIRATIGLLHLEKLMDATKTTNKNRVRNNLMEQLIADPKELQSSSTVETTEEFNADIANSF